MMKQMPFISYNTLKFAPSDVGSKVVRSSNQLISSLKYGLGLKDNFFSSESFWINLTVTAITYTPNT